MNDGLLAFASTLFDQAFPEDAFIGETRLEPRELLAETPLPETYPSEASPWPAAGEDAEAHVRAAVHAWFPEPALKDIFGTRGVDRVALGRWRLALMGAAGHTGGDLEARAAREALQ